MGCRLLCSLQWENPNACLPVDRKNQEEGEADGSGGRGANSRSKVPEKVRGRGIQPAGDVLCFERLCWKRENTGNVCLVRFWA